MRIIFERWCCAFFYSSSASLSSSFSLLHSSLSLSLSVSLFLSYFIHTHATPATSHRYKFSSSLILNVQFAVLESLWHVCRQPNFFFSYSINHNYSFSSHFSNMKQQNFLLCACDAGWSSREMWVWDETRDF